MAEQEYKDQLTAFHFSLGARDAEVAEWFLKQPNKGAYLKSLILADKAVSGETEICAKPTSDNLRWEEHFELLKEFKEQFGRLPTYSESYKGFRLGRWLHDTARRARINRPDRIEKLQSVGIVNKWERNLALVARFHAAYGRFPCKNEVFQGVNIGSWLAVQCAKLRNDPKSFSETQLKSLNDLGIFASDWDKKCFLLESFKAEYGRLPKYTESYHEVNLGRWLANQRKSLDPDKHSDRIDRFKSLGALPYPLPKKQRLKVKA